MMIAATEPRRRTYHEEPDEADKLDKLQRRRSKRLRNARREIREIRDQKAKADIDQTPDQPKGYKPRTRRSGPKYRGQPRQDKLMNSVAKQEAYMRHSREMHALDLMRYRARKLGLPDTTGEKIVLVIGQRELAKLWHMDYPVGVSRTLSWLEERGWIQSERDMHRAADGTWGAGRRIGRYCLGEIDMPYTGDGPGRRVTKWLSGTIV